MLKGPEWAVARVGNGKKNETKTEAGEQSIREGTIILEELGIKPQVAYGYQWFDEV